MDPSPARDWIRQAQTVELNSPEYRALLGEVYAGETPVLDKLHEGWPALKLVLGHYLGNLRVPSKAVLEAADKGCEVELLNDLLLQAARANVADVITNRFTRVPLLID